MMKVFELGLILLFILFSLIFVSAAVCSIEGIRVCFDVSTMGDCSNNVDNGCSCWDSVPSGCNESDSGGTWAYNYSNSGSCTLEDWSCYNTVWVGGKYCLSGDVYRDRKSFSSCGSNDGECDYGSANPVLIDTCSFDCSGGVCTTCTPSYKNNCDNTNGCGGTRTTSPYNACGLTSNISCGVESNPLQCDGLDNDCDGTKDNGVGMECVKNVYSTTLPNWRNGDCTPACTVCQDNKILDINFFSVDNGSDNNALNYFSEESVFRVELTAESPDDCIVGYEYELFYKDEGSAWLSFKDWSKLENINDSNQDSTFGTDGFRQSVTDSNKDSFEFSMRYMPVGRNYLVKVKVVDEKNGRNKSGFVYADNAGASSNIIKVINSQPRKPPAILERVGTPGNFDLNCSISQTSDKDVFTPYGSQELKYYGRIFEDGGVSGSFIEADSSNRVFIDLLNERKYCCEVKANDAVVDSEIFNTCSDPIHVECEFESGKTFLPQGEGVIIGNNFYPTSFFGDSIWNYSPEKNFPNLDYCQWGCADGYDINTDTLYSCDRITENSCELPDGKTTLPSPNVVLGDIITADSLTWTYTSVPSPGVCEWTCMLNAVPDASSYGCVFEGGNTCLIPTEQSGLPNGFVELGPNNFVGDDKEWVYVADYAKDLGACEWRCQNEIDYSVDTTGYGCSNKIVSPFTPTCSDLGFVFVSQASKIEGGKTKIDLNVSCKNASFRVVDEEITINKIRILSSENVLLYSRDLSLECERAINTLVGIVLDLNENASYIYSIDYGIDFFGEDINCNYMGSISAISQEEDVSIPDSNLFVVVLILIIVSIVLVNGKEKKS